ncbi:MAG: lysophospholipid acyltransferase family protein [Desulfobacterales bacterium]|jgi:1-acyl-sn-glycerol-3-phosphate acyltransferase
MMRFFSALYLFFFIVSSSVLFPVAVVLWLCTVWWDRRLVILHRYSCLWASLYLWVNPFWRLDISGRKHIDPRKTYVVISNHQSLLDILVAYRLFFHFKWVAKAELFRVPFVGWNMVLNRYIGLKREDTTSIRQMMSDCRAALKEGSSVFLFPEGTRSEDGSIKPFRAGAFMLAKKAKTPILPIVIDGTADAIPKGRLVISGRRRLALRVLPEVSRDEVDRLSTKELMALCHGLISKGLEQIAADIRG